MLLAVGLWGLAVGGWKKLLAFGCWLLAKKNEMALVHEALAVVPPSELNVRKRMGLARR